MPESLQKPPACSGERKKRPFLIAGVRGAPPD